MEAWELDITEYFDPSLDRMVSLDPHDKVWPAFEGLAAESGLLWAEFCNKEQQFSADDRTKHCFPKQEPWKPTPHLSTPSS